MTPTARRVPDDRDGASRGHHAWTERSAGRDRRCGAGGRPRRCTIVARSGGTTIVGRGAEHRADLRPTADGGQLDDAVDEAVGGREANAAAFAAELTSDLDQHVDAGEPDEVEAR